MNVRLCVSAAMALSLVVSTPVFSGCRKGPEVPDFELPALEGGDCKLSQEKGKVVVLSFWSFGCPYCREQIEEFRELIKMVDMNKVAIVAVHTRGGVEAAERLRMFEGNPEIQICLDDGTVAKKYNELEEQYRGRGVPHNLILDKKGRIRKVRRGRTKAADLKKDIESLL